MQIKTAAYSDLVGPSSLLFYLTADGLTIGVDRTILIQSNCVNTFDCYISIKKSVV